jgi:hypothetical protein
LSLDLIIPRSRAPASSSSAPAVRMQSPAICAGVSGRSILSALWSTSDKRWYWLCIWSNWTSWARLSHRLRGHGGGESRRSDTLYGRHSARASSPHHNESVERHRSVTGYFKETQKPGALTRARSAPPVTRLGKTRPGSTPTWSTPRS